MSGAGLLLWGGGEARDERRALGMAAHAQVVGVPWVVLRPSAGEADGLERADGGPRPAATPAVRAGQERAAALLRLREAARARVGTP